MREYILYMWLGVWLLVLASSSFGVPGSWKDTFLILTALFIITHSFIGHRRTRKEESVDVSVAGNSESREETGSN
ncbi:MAG: hypothetical protein AAB767_04505 [Patescibacteria group bacterium]